MSSFKIRQYLIDKTFKVDVAFSIAIKKLSIDVALKKFGNLEFSINDCVKYFVDRCDIPLVPVYFRALSKMTESWMAWEKETVAKNDVRRALSKAGILLAIIASGYYDMYRDAADMSHVIRL